MTEEDLFVTPRHPPLPSQHEIRAIEVKHAPELSYVVPIEPSWVTAMPTRERPPTRGQPISMGLFAEGPSFDGPRVVVSTQTMVWEVDPLEWLRFSWAASGWRVVVARMQAAAGGPRYEIGALRQCDGGHEVRRSFAVRSGAKIVRVDACSALDVWPKWHDSLWASLDGFALGTKPAQRTIESLTPREGPLVRFATPQSWDARGSGSKREGVRWAAAPVRDVQRGSLLQVLARDVDDSPTATQRRDRYWKHARKEHDFVGAPDPVARPVLEGLGEGEGWGGQWQAAVRTEGGRGVLVVVQRELGGVAVDYVLQAPAAGTQHVDWMRATRALDIAVATTQTRRARAAYQPGCLSGRATR